MVEFLSFVIVLWVLGACVVVQGIEFYNLALKPPYRDAIGPGDYAHGDFSLMCFCVVVFLWRVLCLL